MQTTVNSLSTPQTYDLAALSLLYALAHRCVARQHVAPDDRADCVQAFFVCLLQQDRLRAAVASHAFAAQCATNFARNYNRDQARMTRHETAYPQYTDEEGAVDDREFVQEAKTVPATII